MKIIITVQTNFGNEAIYPVCATARNLAEIAGTKTLTRSVLGIIKKMGYEIEVQAPSISL